MSKIYGVYDVSNHEQCVLITDRVKKVAEYLNKTEHYIQSVISYDKIVAGKYKVIRLGNEHDIDNSEV